MSIAYIFFLWLIYDWFCFFLLLLSLLSFDSAKISLLQLVQPQSAVVRARQVNWPRPDRAPALLTWNNARPTQQRPPAIDQLAPDRAVCGASTPTTHLATKLDQCLCWSCRCYSLHRCSCCTSGANTLARKFAMAGAVHYQHSKIHKFIYIFWLQFG